jgi:sulfur-carrier protein adenylyltransferase/sulfurtransferase
MKNDQQYDRYQRQIILPGFGAVAQQKLLQAKVLVVGAGGLGCPVLQYLTAAGVGTIGIVDSDVVSLSNLHRQVLYSVHDIGLSKAEKAVDKLQQLNPETRFHSYNRRITSNNAESIIRPYDIVIDGSDNFATRYLVNDACVLLDKTLVYGAVSQYQGQVAIFNCALSPNRTPVNYQDLFPQPPAENEVLNCEEAGVLGVLPGLIGTMMANEAIKLIANIGRPLIDRLITYDARNNQLYEIELMARNETRSMIPADLEALKKTDYELHCSSLSGFEIDNEFFNQLLERENVDVIDVREKSELPIITQFEHRSVPLAELQDCIGELKSSTIVLFCQSGKRSLQAAQQLNSIFGDSRKIFSLRGGIVTWKADIQMQRHE